MAQIKQEILQSKAERQKFRHAPAFAPAGQSTQMIVGASDETDYHILKLSEGMYRKYGLKRVFFSAYVPVTHSPLLPSPLSFRPPLLREHRLYQSDWLLRFYHFQADELLSPDHPTLNPQLDPKCSWAHVPPGILSRGGQHRGLSHPPAGPGHRGGQCPADSLRRRWRSLDHTALGKLGVVLKRAQYFITCSGKMTPALRVTPAGVLRALTLLEAPALPAPYEQLSLFPA